jgi:hypothetical protein
VAIYEYAKVSGAVVRMAIATQGDVRPLHGMTAVENVHGPAARVLGWLDASAMTLGSYFVFSTTKLTDETGELNDLGKHEILGHGAQGAEMGELYTPIYLLEWAAA